MSKRFLTAALAALLIPAAASAAFVQGDFGRLDVPAKAADATLEAAAEVAIGGILVDRFDAVGDEEMEVLRVNRAEDGTYVRFQQSFNGLKVYGADLLMHVDNNGSIHTITGDFVPSTKLAVAPTLGAEEALAFAMGRAALKINRASAPELSYLIDGRGGATLVWNLVVEYTDVNGPQRDRVFADAATGELVARHPGIYYGKSLRTYDCNGNQPGTNSTSGCSLVSSTAGPITNGDAAEDAAHNYANATYDYYYSNYGRDSINGSGMTMKSRVHYGNNYNNAFWDGYMMTYGDGDGSTFIALSRDADVVAHELTHGVTSNESNLIYQNESGALNEAWSDVFGAAVDRELGESTSDTWKIGEDIYTPGTSGDALRNMADPASQGDYDYYPTRYTGSADNGGVHSNSGIANLAFKLLVTGGTHPRGKTSVNVPALNGNFNTSLDRAARIFYEANTNCLTASSGFSSARSCTASKANSLYGSSARDAVHCAWDAVGAPGSSTCGGGGGGGGCSANSGSASNTSASSGNWNRYTWTVPANCSQYQVKISGGSGDADLYSRFGSQPTTSSYNCRPYLNGNNETCTHSNPSAGTWHIGVRAYSTFSGVKVEASHQ